MSMRITALACGIGGAVMLAGTLLVGSGRVALPNAAAQIAPQVQLQAQLSVRAEPVQAIIAAFRTHAIVAFPGPFDRLLPQLFAAPEFASAVNDLVVEFGNARYQDVMDRFQRGETVSDAELRH